PFLVGVGVCGLIVIVLTGTLLRRSLRAPVSSGLDALIGQQGTVVRHYENVWYARVQGEVWRVESDKPLTMGQPVVVRQAHGLVLIVEPHDISALAAAARQGQ